jgi:hypothetical protein
MLWSSRGTRDSGIGVVRAGQIGSNLAQERSQIRTVGAMHLETSQAYPVKSVKLAEMKAWSKLPESLFPHAWSLSHRLTRGNVSRKDMKSSMSDVQGDAGTVVETRLDSAIADAWLKLGQLNA